MCRRRNHIEEALRLAFGAAVRQARLMYSVDDLEMAERHVDEGRQRIAEQHERIAQLRRDGHSTALAEDFLKSMIELLAQMEAHRDEIAAAVAAQPRSAGASRAG
jgi:hypothetical protein